LTGGKRVGNKGYYIEPTIFSNVKVDLLLHPTMKGGYFRKEN